SKECKEESKLKKQPLVYYKRKQILFNSYGLKYEPRNEEEVKFVFYNMAKILGFEILRLSSNIGLDCLAEYKGKEINIEFEYGLSGVLSHKYYNYDDIDLIIYWIHDIEITDKKLLNLKELIKQIYLNEK
ncbi:unnamed protein product, partial [marine sediment metagenome]